MTEQGDVRGAARDELLAALFDRFLEDVLDGRDSDLDPILAEHPDLAVEIEETWRLARETAGRRAQPRPVVEGYQLIRELGRGGMGVVYLAEHEHLGRQVALKVLPAAASLSPSAKRRFLTEARALARVDSEHVVRIHNIIERPDLLAYEMEWVDGTSLRDLLERLWEGRRGRDPTISDARKILGASPGALGERSLLLYYVRIGVSIARALAAAHGAGLVHRDVKPSNILIRRDGTALLADFGLVRGTDASVTRTVGFVGTLRYASPEQLREDREETDARTDVYSLGVTLWEALAGRPPFDGNSSVALLRKIESGLVPRLRRVAPHVPRDLETVLAKAMEPNPATRYQTAAELADDLERILRLEPVRARPVGPIRRSGRWLRRNRRYGIAAAAGIALGIAVLLPGVVEARSREARERRAAALIQEARLALLSPVASRRAFAQAVLGRPTQSFRINREAPPLEPALRAYDELLSLRPDDEFLAIERTVVAVAAASDRGLAGRDDVPSYDLSRLPPLTAEVATQLVRGNLVATIAPEELLAAETHDRAALGLLAYLVGDLGMCEQAWHGFDTLGADQPLVDAGLGIVYRSDGRPERAYGRLMRAVRTFPDSVFLRTELAIAALAIGESSLARTWIGQLAAMPDADPDTVDRLAAELATADGDWSGAREHYRRIVERGTGLQSIAALGLGEAERLDGDAESALGRFRELVEEFPAAPRFRLALARAALEAGDRATYLHQAVWAVKSDFGAGRSAGSMRDVREILRIGGLRGLYERALDQTGAFALPDELGFWPPSSLLTGPFRETSHVERLVETVAGIEAAEPRFWLPDQGRSTRAAAELLSLATRTACETPLPIAGPSQFVVRGTALAVAAGWTDLVADLLPALLGVPDPTGTERHLIRRWDGLGPGHGIGSIAIAGDVDGDGWPEIAFSPILEPSSDPALPSAQLCSPRSGSVLWSIRREADSPDVLGASLTNVGDVDGDGLDDLAVGGNREDRDQTNAGMVAVFSSVGGRRLSDRIGDRTDGRFGASIVGLGDIDGDGASDFAVGEMAEMGAAGRVFLVSGRSAAVLRIIEGPPGAQFGVALANLGDLDEDGFPDLAIGAMTAHQTEGRVFLHSGRTGARLRELSGGEDVRLFGMCVHAGPDLDGDGIPELIVGAPLSGTMEHRPGALFVFFADEERPPIRLDGERDRDLFGISCTTGDFSGDGTPDLAVGSAFATRNGDESGEVVVLDGRDLEARVVLARFQGESAGAQFGAKVLAYPDLDGDGAEQLLVSSPGTRERRGSVFLLSVQPLR